MIGLAGSLRALGPLTIAQQDLAARNMGLARHYARAWVKRQPAHAGDLECEAFLGLTKAAAAWSPDRAGPFALYARGWIRSALKGYVSRLRPRGCRSGGGLVPNTTSLGFDPIDHRGLPVGSDLEAADQLEPHLQQLPEQHAGLLRSLYVFGADARSLGHSSGLSRSRVYRMRRQSFAILKAHSAQIETSACTRQLAEFKGEVSR